MHDDWLIPSWPRPGGIRAAVSTRWIAGESVAPFDTFNLGAHCGDIASAVAANRKALRRLLTLPGDPFWLNQVHGTAVHVVDSAGTGGSTSTTVAADAAVTRVPGAVLAVLTADCLPVLFCAADGSEIGIAHAGWRGLAAGVLEATLAQMHTAPESVLAWLGPAIGGASYEVGSEVRQAFVDTDAGAVDAFRATRPGHWCCDLAALARRRLTAVGVRSLHGGGFDTFSDPRFYSYRRDRRTGRFASLIWREPG